MQMEKIHDTCMHSFKLIFSEILLMKIIIIIFYTCIHMFVVFIFLRNSVYFAVKKITHAPEEHTKQVRSYSQCTFLVMLPVTELLVHVFTFLSHEAKSIIIIMNNKLQINYQSRQ